MSRTMKKRVAELRAEPIKSLAEQRGVLLAELDELLGKAKAEVRALTDEESKRVTEIEQEVNKLSATMEAEQRAEKLKAAINMKNAKDAAEKSAEQRAEGAASDGEKNDDTAKAEERAVMNYIYKQCNLPAPEVRAGEQNIDMGSNGAIIPTTIANRVIDKVKEICPIMNGAERYAVKGTLKIPVWSKANDTHDITVNYQEEFSELTADAGKFTSVDLTGYLAGALTLIGKSVINNSEIDVLNFIINKMARNIAQFIEKEALIGTDGKAQGAVDVENEMEAKSSTAITADELIDLQSMVPAALQADACWTLNPKTFTSFKKLKDASGQYLLMQNLSNISKGFSYTLLGKPVYLSESMPEMQAGAKAVLYGDYSGLGINFRQQIEMEILKEKYATMHAVGVVAWFEFDSKVIDHQKLAILKMKANGA